LLPGYQKEWDKDRYVVGYELKIKNQKSKLNGENKKWFWKRITVTPKALRSLDYALVVAMGEGKREAVGKLKWEVARLPARQGDRKLDINHYPAGILGQMKEVDVYTDVDL